LVRSCMSHNGGDRDSRSSGRPHRRRCNAADLFSRVPSSVSETVAAISQPITDSYAVQVPPATVVERAGPSRLVEMLHTSLLYLAPVPRPSNCGGCFNTIKDGPIKPEVLKWRWDVMVFKPKSSPLHRGSSRRVGGYKADVVRVDPWFAMAAAFFSVPPFFR
jgi:hypothetical protein